MKSRTSFLLTISIFAVLGILLLQLYWLNQFYSVSKKDFERQVTLSFEEALGKEFDERVDTITMLMVEEFLDTAKYHISSAYDKILGRHQYKIANATDKNDALSFTSFTLNEPLLKDDNVLKRKIALEYAARIKEEDLKNHFVISRLQNLGAFLDIKVKELSFDTARLRPILTSLLEQRKIVTPFQFYLSYKDSTIDIDSITNTSPTKSPLITKPYLTYKWWDKDEKYVRCIFINPAEYILSKMKWMIFASIALVLLAGCCGYLLFKAWMKEKKLSKIKDDFINNITHELKTPVATISAAVEALSDFNVLEDKNKAQRYLKHSAIELNRLNDLMNKVLNISLSENKIPDIRIETISIPEALKQITDGLQLAAQPKQVDFEFHYGNDNYTIKADKLYFTETISNVVQNAIKYAGEHVNIKICCQSSGEKLEIAISDNGWGINNQDIPFVFDKFYRGIRKDHLVKGHGLGLYHVKQIMEMHKGTISINSKKEKGTTVYLRWPI